MAGSRREGPVKEAINTVAFALVIFAIIIASLFMFDVL